MVTQQQRLIRIAQATQKLHEVREAGRYEGSLIEFANYVWPVVEPAIPFIRGWAIDAIAEHLQAVTAGQIRRLLINVPPGFSKSLMTDVFWPAWEWGPKNRPWYRYVCAAYSNHLTERDNMRCRNIVMSDRYQRLWGDRFHISNEQFTKVKFANDQTGWKLATSTGGIGVGERGDRFIIDDANNTMMMESAAVRSTVNMWLTEVVPDRLNNPKESAIVIIQQRLHEEDVSGTVLKRELGYTHLEVPMEYESRRHCVTVLGEKPNGDPIIWEDPRGLADDGTPLLMFDEDKNVWYPKDEQAAEIIAERENTTAWPERFGDKEIDELKRAKGPYAWAGQYQQNPEPRGGSILKRDYWQTWEEPDYPSFEYILASLDTAYTEKEENDASALTIWGVFRDDNNNPRLMLLYAIEMRLEFHELVQKVMDICTVDKKKTSVPYRVRIDRLLIEAKASGLSVYQEMRRLMGFSGQFGIELVNPSKQGDKVARAHAVVHLFADKMIFRPNRSWADAVVHQCALFPRSSHDDFVDSVTMALRYLRDMNFALKNEEQEAETDRLLTFRPRGQALYPV